jgi:oligosaccharide repeat unit polymerase
MTIRFERFGLYLLIISIFSSVVYILADPFYKSSAVLFYLLLIISLFPLVDNDLTIYKPTIVKLIFIDIKILIVLLLWIINGEPFLEGYLYLVQGDAIKYFNIFIIIYTIGQLSYYISFYNREKRQYNNQVSIKKNIESLISLKALKKIAILLYLFSLLCYLLMIVKIGGLGSLINGWEQRSQTFSGLYIYQFGVELIIISVVILYFVYLKTREGKMVTFISILISIIVVLSLGGRGMLLNLLFSLIILNAITKSIKVPKKVVFLIPVMILILFLIYDVRGYIQVHNTLQGYNFSITGLNEILNSFSQRGYVERSVILLSDIFPNKDFLYGYTFFGLLVFWIPRAIFPNKPIVDEGSLFREMYLPGIVSGGYPTGWTSILYWNFGIAAVILGYVLLGLFHRKLYKVLHVNDKYQYIFILFYACSFVYLLNLSNFNFIYLFKSIFIFGVIFKLTHYQKNNFKVI